MKKQRTSEAADREAPAARAQMEDRRKPVALRLHLPGDTLASVDNLCRACKMEGVTRDEMVNVLLVTGITYWQAQDRKDRRRKAKE
jgi:hypothetical protein